MYFAVNSKQKHKKYERKKKIKRGLSEREEKVLSLITESNISSVSEISKILGVSSVTIRNDLNSLADKGLIIRTHGGASPAFHPGVTERQRLRVEEKNRIAKKAASLVNDGDAIMVEAGTTSSLIVKYLLGKRDIQLVSTSTLILPFVRVNPGIHLTLVGGEFRPSTESLVGPIALSELSRFFVRLAFVGTDGFSIEGGLTTYLVEGAEVVKMMSSRAERTILVADSSKYGRRGFVHVLDIGEIDELITDSGLDRGIVRELEGMGIKVYIV